MQILPKAPTTRRLLTETRTDTIRVRTGISRFGGLYVHMQGDNNEAIALTFDDDGLAHWDYDEPSHLTPLERYNLRRTGQLVPPTPKKAPVQLRSKQTSFDAFCATPKIQR